MRYLSGATNGEIEALLLEAGIGLMTSQNIAYAVERVARFDSVGLDNGCFSANWAEDEWVDWLAIQPRHNALFAVAPDVYPDAAESLRRGLEFAPIVRDLGFPVAVVAQDGAESMYWPWDDIDCLFIGGAKTTDPRAEWKESDAAAELASAARSAGKWVHRGSVNDEYRYARAELMGCQSVDGTMVAFGPDINTPRLIRMVRRRNNAPPLPFTRYEAPTHPNHRERENQ
jgi:hypothetical protein